MTTTTTGPPLPLSAAALAHDKWLSRFRTVLVVILGGTVTGIASLAFYTSFEAIKAYAERSGGISPAHAWAVPLLVDSFIVVATGADLWFTTTKAQRRWWEVWWPKALLGGAAGGSFILNVAHADDGSWAARGVAAIPPAALVLGVELLMMVLRRATAIRATRLQAEVDKQQLELAALESPPASPVRGEITRKPRKPRREMPAPSAQGASSPHAAASAQADAEDRRAEPPAPAEPAAPPAAAAGRDPSVPIFTPAGSETAVAAAPAADKRPVASTRKPAPPEPAAPAAADPARPTTAEAVFSSGRSLRADKRPGARDRNGKPLTPYVVAARILDEREGKEHLTPEALVQALAAEGLTVTVPTAQELLRELRPPLASRLAAAKDRG